MHPKIIVCLGRISAMKIIRPDFKITKEAWNLFLKKTALCSWQRSTPPPCSRNPSSKPGAFDDFIKLREKMEELGLVEKEA